MLSAIAVSLLLAQAQAQCSLPTLSAKYAAPSVAPGYQARLVANGLSRPRSILFDSSGNLLVVESRKGITALKLNDGGGSCIGVQSTSTVVDDNTLNHGIELSRDGKTLYASNSDKAFSWPYDGASAKTTGSSTTLVEGMDNSDHTTRTLLLSRKVDNRLVISRGSGENIDPNASDLNSGISQIKVFELGNSTEPYNYSGQGTRLGWGLRNSVGVAEHPVSGGIYSVENSADNIDRNGQDIHTNNPGEEMNFHGYLNGTRANPDVRGANFGYPACFAAWRTNEIPNPGNLRTGSQFQIGERPDDEVCARNSIAPVLTFPAHWAPLDIKFNTRGSVAYITSRGSWNRQPPDGYLLFAVPFRTTGTPVAAPDSQNSWTPIMSNANNNDCPDGCFRPVGLAWDRNGRLFMTSDSTGEIYVITATNGSGIDAMDMQSSSNSTNTPRQSEAGSIGTSGWALMIALFATWVMA